MLKELHGEAAEWTATDYLLATVIDQLAEANWMFATVNRDDDSEPLGLPGTDSAAGKRVDRHGARSIGRYSRRKGRSNDGPASPVLPLTEVSSSDRAGIPHRRGSAERPAPTARTRPPNAHRARADYAPCATERSGRTRWAPLRREFPRRCRQRRDADDLLSGFRHEFKTRGIPVFRDKTFLQRPITSIPTLFSRRFTHRGITPNQSRKGSGNRNKQRKTQASASIRQ